MEMVFSPLALIVVVVFGLFVLGGIAVVVMLLANSKTRVVGAVLLTIGLLLAAVFGVAVLRYRAVRYDRRQVQEARVMIEMERAAEEVRARESAIRESEPLSPDMNEETPVPEPAAEPAEEVEPTEALGQVEPAPQTEPEKLAAAEDAPVANEDAPVASEKPDKSGNVLRAMARALGKALGDARKQTKGNVPADGGEDSASDVSVKTEVSPATVESEPAAPETEAGDDEAADDQAASETAEEQPPTIPDDREPAAGPGSDETTKTGTVIPAAATPEVAGQNVERPAWVGAPAQRTGDGYRTSVTVGPYMTRQECERALPAALQTAVAEYVDVFIGPRAARRVRLSPQYVTDHVVRESWEETVTVTLDPNRVVLDSDDVREMVQLHVLLEFDPEVESEVEQRWRAVILNGRLWYAGVGGAAALMLLSVLFGTLKMDQATHGACRGRLGTAGVVAAVAVTVVAWGVMRSGDDFPIGKDAAPLAPPSPQMSLASETPQQAGRPRMVTRVDAKGALVVLSVPLLLAGIFAVSWIARKRQWTLGFGATALIVSLLVVMILGALAVIH